MYPSEWKTINVTTVPSLWDWASNDFFSLIRHHALIFSTDMLLFFPTPPWLEQKHKRPKGAPLHWPSVPRARGRCSYFSTRSLACKWTNSREKESYLVRYFQNKSSKTYLSMTLKCKSIRLVPLPYRLPPMSNSFTSSSSTVAWRSFYCYKILCAFFAWSA